MRQAALCWGSPEAVYQAAVEVAGVVDLGKWIDAYGVKGPHVGDNSQACRQGSCLLGCSWSGDGLGGRVLCSVAHMRRLS